MDLTPLHVIRYIVGFSVMYWISMSFFRYFTGPENFFIERFRKKSAYTTQKELLVRAFVGMGLILPFSFALGIIIMGWELPHPTTWLFLTTSSGLVMGAGSYAYFRLLRYRKLNVEEAECGGGEIDALFVKRESLPKGVTLPPKVVKFVVWTVIIGFLLALFLHPAIFHS